MKTSDFSYDLPEELIAQTPLDRRDASRLLVLDKKTGALEHRHFSDIVDYLAPGDLLVLNDSRVIPARLLGARETGGAAELLLLNEKDDGRWECLARPGRRLKVGAKVIFGEGELTAVIEQVLPDGNRNAIRPFIRKISAAPPLLRQDFILLRNFSTSCAPRAWSCAF